MTPDPDLVPVFICKMCNTGIGSVTSNTSMRQCFCGRVLVVDGFLIVRSEPWGAV